ncbi:ATP-binding protein [Stenotrophomonas sp. PS02298]|uniref:ATP-binding response regulator n=1 Tax=Stenotrophomonas sp. PS02298 TaxID=2991424 RepID=UPI002499B24F|nr:ATP-binding protein [Stenotrophomonas sp. PS02298]
MPAPSPDSHLSLLSLDEEDLESSSLYREVFNAVASGFCVIELVFEQGTAVDFIYRKVNAGFQKVTGLSNVTGRRASEVVPAMEADWFQAFGRVVSEGGISQFERQVSEPSRWYSVEAVRIGKPDKHQVAVFLFDISARKRIETELAESEARFSALADGLPMPVWVVDDRGQLRFVNAAFFTFFGLPADQDLGPDPWQRLLHPDERASFEYELQAALNGRTELHANTRVRRHDGQWRWLEMNAVPRFSADGRFIGLAGNSPDITERREIEMAREDLLTAERVARNAAEGMARMKDEFLATLSHELRTPLTTVLGWSELLLQRMEADHPMRRGMEVIASSAMTQKNLMSDMLDLSSMLLGKVQLEVEVLDLSEQLREAVRAQELVAEGKAQTVVLELPELPQPVLGDATRLQQILGNLLSNAIKFTPVEGRIEISLQHEAGHLVVQIKDDGDGIAPEFLEHLFSRFSQADSTTTRRHGGLGLGLAIVQQLTELHGGTVSAASEGSGRGATFHLRLPEFKAQKAVNHPRRRVQRGRIGEQVLVPNALQGLRVLAVEDQVDMLGYIRRLLEEQGASVVTASTAAEALELLDLRGHTAFDVLISDIGMPGMDGYGLIHTLRETLGVGGDELPAVAVTALARADDRRRAFSSGFQGHLAKPYSVAQLISAIRDARLPR